MARPIRVLTVIKGLGPGGAERLVVNQLARSNDRIRYELFVCAERQPNLLDEVQALGVPVHLGYVGRRPWPLELRSVLGRGRFDIVHVHLPIAAVGARLMSRTVRPRPRVVYTEHNRWPSYVLPTRLANRWTSWLDDTTFAVSEDAAASMRFPMRRAATVVDHGVAGPLPEPSAETRHRLRNELGVDENTIVIGTVANLRREKAQAALIDAFAALTVQPAPHLAIVGQGPLRDQLEAAARASGAQARIHFLGYRADAPSVAAGFDVFTLPSDHEGRPVALMEAMTMGLPVVVSDAGDMANMVEHDVSGLVVPAGDVAALTDALGSAAADQDLRARLSRGAAAAARAIDGSAAFETIEAAYLRLTAPA